MILAESSGADKPLGLNGEEPPRTVRGVLSLRQFVALNKSKFRENSPRIAP